MNEGPPIQDVLRPEFEQARAQYARLLASTPVTAQLHPGD
jgi:hypothetical protein